MALSLNSVAVVCHSTLQTKLQNSSRPFTGVSGLKTNYVVNSFRMSFGSRRGIKNNRRGLMHLLATESNQIAAELDKGSENAKSTLSDDQLLETKPPSLIPPSEVKTETLSPQKASKRSSLTAREKLRAARVLSRYPDSKPPKQELGRKVLDALRESDGGNRRTGLPEAPTNMLDDSKRGMPKQGLTFDFPGGFDLFLIIFSTVFISTLMFSTTYLVWKVGAIHFNDQ
ncbi:hypothetical protein GIB67_014320 [Kingdonia uniflora]|uniref:Uncharacterized protein n=1 Tax=Kingdonia uniflora TaxID=39325 RepID=A0A7J7NTM6_9MAGN|nr:hypothetical protein GIB67_014320 [Kingdonia uniflora]